MTLATRYLLKGFLFLFLLCLVGATFLFLIIDFVGNTKIWLTRPPEDKYIYYLNYLPHIIYLVCPIAVLLASVFSVGMLSKHLELVALKTAGLPLRKILRPILFFAALLSGTMLIFQDRVLPDANHRRYAINEPKSLDHQSGDPQERFNFLYTASDGSLFHMDYYSARRVEGSGVTILKLEGNRPVSRIDAHSLRYLNDTWRLVEGTERVFKGNELIATPFTERVLKSFNDSPQDLLDDRVYPEEMDWKELDRRISIQQRNGENARVYLTHWHFRWSSAIVNFVMAVIGVALSVNTIRSGLARNFGIALLITFLYYIALRVGLVMGENGTLAPLQAAWLGNTLFAPIGMVLWWRAARV